MAESVTPQELAELKASGKALRLIDVRSRAEYRALRIGFAESMPLNRLDIDALRSSASNEPFYVICQTDPRAIRACERLKEAGLGAILVKGGTAAWAAAGLPVERSGEGVISLERQVRIGAGIMVLLGVLLGALIHPAAYALSAFVGAGLIFAGVTGWCGLGLLLAKAPWNQTAD